jgi:hypothetical protein
MAGNDSAPATRATAAAPGSAAGAFGVAQGSRLRIALGTASASVVVALWGGGMLAFGAILLAFAQVRGGR